MSGTTSTSASDILFNPPPELQYGIASVPPRVPRNFRGRSGIWACEACGKTKLLTAGTLKWTCEQCETVLYTIPEYECPLEKARRFIKLKKTKDHEDNTSKEKEQAQTNNNTKDSDVAANTK